MERRAAEKRAGTSLGVAQSSAFAQLNYSDGAWFESSWV